MKKSIVCVLFAALLSAVGVSAQVADVSFYPQGKALAKDYEPRFIGSDGRQAVFVQMSGRLKNKMELVAYDMEQNELGRVFLTDDEEVNCYGGYINGDNVDLLMAEWKDEGMRVYRDRHDAKTLQPAGEALTLADFKGTQGDKMGFSLSVSPNQQLLAGLYLIGRENQMGELQVGLYSRELEEYWKMDSRCRNLDFMYVTDSGEVILGSYKDKKYNIYILDGEKEDEYHFEADATPAELQVARYADGKVYLVLTHSGKTDWRENGVQADYVGVVCFDTKTKRAKVDRHAMTKEDYNRMNNEKNDAKVKKDDYRVMYMNLVQTLEDESGCYAVFDQTWRVTLDGVPSSHHRLGMMVCRINNDGKIEWVKTFRVSNATMWNARRLADYKWVRTAKGPLLVWVEAKGSQDYPDEKPVKVFTTLSSSGVLTAMLLDRDGNTVRQHYEIESKQSLLGSPHLLDNGDYLLIMRGKSRGYFANMSLVK